MQSDKMKDSFTLAVEQTKVQLSKVKFDSYSKTAMGRLYFCIVNEDENTALLKERKFFP